VGSEGDDLTLKSEEDTTILTGSGAGIERMRITGVGGSVGIGTTIPAARLEVRDGGSQGIIVRSDATQTTDDNKALRVRNNSDTDTFSVSHRGLGYFSGSVGIGTTNPATKLDVMDGDITIRNGTEHNAIRTSPDGKLQFLSNAAANNTVRVTIDDNNPGGVGIGTTIPSTTVDVIGGVEINTAEISAFVTDQMPSDSIRTYHLENDIGLKEIRGGLIFITNFANSSTSFGEYPQPGGTGLIYYDSGLTVKTPDIIVQNGTGIEGSTSSSTTVTDFTDDRVTIVCLQDNIRIVNRFSTARKFKLTFL